MTYQPKKFFRDLFASGLVTGLDTLDKEAAAYIPPELIEAIEASPISKEFKDALLPLASRGVGSPAGPIIMLLIGMALGTALGIASPISRVASYKVDELVKSFRLAPGTITELWLRGFPDEEGKEKWWADLKAQGWDESRIDAAKELAWKLPTPQDLVTWQAREVFEPEMISKYGLDDEFEKLDLTLFAKVGLSEDMARNYWRAHWMHATFIQMVEMLHRGIVTEDDFREWFRLVEIPPFWRDKLIEMTWNVPTRVDVRRWWDMRTIDETELKSIYTRQGYHGTDHDNYVLWTKVYVAFPDLISRYRNGWINKDDLIGELVALGMSPERAEEMYQTKFKASVGEERVTETTKLTRSLIIKGAKENKLTKDETIELLIRKKYEPWEAEYIYEIEVEAAASPETPLEFRRLVESWRKSQGLEFKEIPLQLIEAEKSSRDATERLQDAKRKGLNPDMIDSLQVKALEAQMLASELKIALEL
ncbi:hypothetical protein ES703_25834 [subsurface metagenome]